MKENLKTISSTKISKKILHSPTVIEHVDCCKILSEKENEGENGMRDVVENEVIIVEILKKCNWWERIVVRRNKRLILNIYHDIRVNIINTVIK